MVPNVENAFITQAGSVHRQTQRISPAEFVASLKRIMGLMQEALLPTDLFFKKVI